MPASPQPDEAPTEPATDPVTGSASLWVLSQVAGPRRVATVLHAGERAVYLDLDGTCIAVLAADAVQVPNGVRTELDELAGMQAGDEVAVFNGSVELPTVEVLVTTIVDATVPVVAPESGTWGAERITDHAAAPLALARASLPTLALERLAAGDTTAVPALVGLGDGLTPMGDDVLCGWLAAAVARRHPALGEMRSVVEAGAAQRTTTLSATLLACAARGEGIPEFRDLVGAVANHDTAGVEESVDRVLAVGDTSGQGLLLGAVLALGGGR